MPFVRQTIKLDQLIIMKCYFLYNAQKESTENRKPFFQILQNIFESKGRYAYQPENANVFLINNYDCADQVLKIKRKYPSQLFIHRVDEPIKSFKNVFSWRDDIVRFLNCHVADATIFQSQWSKEEHHRFNISSCTSLSTIIPNAPDPLLFNTRQRATLSPVRKPRLISNNWSENWRNDFETLQWIDNNLNFDRYDMTFIGKSPITFNNIRHIQPVSSQEMASWLKQSDIYILAAPKQKACSEVLLEAIHCGVPIVAVNSASNSEFIGNGGALYNDIGDIPETIRKVLKNYTTYQKAIQNPRLPEIAEKYYTFMQSCEKDLKDNSKQLSRLHFVYLRCVLMAWKIFGTIEAMRQT